MGGGGWDPGPSSWERSPLSLHWLMAMGKKALLVFLESFLLASAYSALVNLVARAGLAIKLKQLVRVKYTQQIEQQQQQCISLLFSFWFG